MGYAFETGAQVITYIMSDTEYEKYQEVPFVEPRYPWAY